MSISLSPELERQITERVASGEYDSADEVVRQAMQLLSQRDEQEASNLVLRAKIQEGIDDLENGRHSPLEDVVARLRERYSVPLAI
jgi:antitoxin ParD1/3/4